MSNPLKQENNNAKLWIIVPLLRESRLGEPDRITAADRAALQHRGIDTDVELIVLGRGAQDTWVPWEGIRMKLRP